MSPEDRYQIYDQLYKAYSHYNLDEALNLAKEKKRIALQLNNEQRVYEAEMNIAEMLGKMGMYKETFDIIDRLKRTKLDKNLWGYYFHVYHSIYSLLWKSALAKEEKDRYKSLIALYKDSLLQTYDTASIVYKLNYSAKLIDDNQAASALAFMTNCYKQLKTQDAETGPVAYGLASAYEAVGNMEQQKKYLAITALTDIRAAAKSYIALRKLAVLLYQEGDLGRAYAYIKCAMEDAHFAKARYRMIEISEALPIIVAAYNKKMQEEKNTLSWYLIAISVLFVGLFLAAAFIYKQLRKISATELLVKKKNSELTQINEQLKELNGRLSESDQVKEVYIGYVFNLCSSYINKLENYRINLYKKLKAKQTDEALKMTGTASLVTNELREFFQNFDAVFLNIYPRFIEEFNKLLKEDEQVLPRTGDILTPELRVFALVRLGISDSSKIADFLHYSPQTVYNYKLKIKNKLAIPRDDFMDKIQQIGK
ncbi:DUF6377 domain-containing protein [Niabella sp.]|uniref:DUF6377 domain-containing protein n=1 Tax=Niabella sp. TaxID=1962976 RepID=UPI00261720C5|nr:DUF6377 domain-containing protein [Niabella sp.]